MSISYTKNGVGHTMMFVTSNDDFEDDVQYYFDMSFFHPCITTMSFTMNGRLVKACLVNFASFDIDENEPLFSETPVVLTSTQLANFRRLAVQQMVDALRM